MDMLRVCVGHLFFFSPRFPGRSRYLYFPRFFFLSLMMSRDPLFLLHCPELSALNETPSLLALVPSFRCGRNRADRRS